MEVAFSPEGGSLRSKIKRLRKFLHLTPTDQRLLVRAVILLRIVRLGLWLLPFQTLHRLLICRTKVARRLRNSEPVSQDGIAWAVAVAGKYALKTPNCLAQALAAHLLLNWASLPARLNLGVARGREGELEGHAWVESDGKVIVGGFGLERYTVLSTNEGYRP